jgi:hypothetical protein
VNYTVESSELVNDFVNLKKRMPILRKQLSWDKKDLIHEAKEALYLFIRERYEKKKSAAILYNIFLTSMKVLNF